MTRPGAALVLVTAALAAIDGLVLPGGPGFELFRAFDQMGVRGGAHA